MVAMATTLKFGLINFNKMIINKFFAWHMTKFKDHVKDGRACAGVGFHDNSTVSVEVILISHYFTVNERARSLMHLSSGLTRNCK